jgi:hypothetical protein
MTNDDREAQEFERAQRAKLGDGAAGRIRAVETYLKSKMNQERYETFRMTVTTAAAIEMIEKHISTSPSQTGPNKIPGYSAMSFEQRRAAQWNRANRAK